MAASDAWNVFVWGFEDFKQNQLTFEVVMFVTSTSDVKTPLILNPDLRIDIKPTWVPDIKLVLEWFLFSFLRAVENCRPGRFPHHPARSQ